MKTLPDNPNLDHLRKHAKDLLAGLRDSDPGATLADAQASLAEQYGFRTWTDLKAEVDLQQRRADVADPALARELASRFRLGEVTGPMRSVSRPDEVGRRWLLRTDRGDWAPRTVDVVFPVTDGEDNANLQEAAARAGVTLPAPVRSLAGAVIEACRTTSPVRLAGPSTQPARTISGTRTEACGTCSRTSRPCRHTGEFSTRH